MHYLGEVLLCADELPGVTDAGAPVGHVVGRPVAGGEVKVGQALAPVVAELCVARLAWHLGVLKVIISLCASLEYFEKKLDYMMYMSLPPPLAGCTPWRRPPHIHRSHYRLPGYRRPAQCTAATCQVNGEN